MTSSPSSDATVDVDPVGLAVGRSIREARLAASMSMRALAVKAGVGQSFLSEVERGRAMPSIASLYRIAQALGVAPSTLLPSFGEGDVHVVRAGEGQMVASSERERSAKGRVVFADESLGLEVYEYRTDRSEDLDVWFRHEGEKVLHLVEGRLRVEFDRPGEPSRVLRAGDTIVHSGRIPHRWVVEGRGAVRLFLVITTAN